MQVDYITHMGDDMMVVNVAKVSFDKAKPHWDESCEKLIRYLARHRHWTPFAHPQIQMRVTCPLFVAAQLKRHIVGATEGGCDIAALNEVSRRYVKDPPAFFSPKEWRRKPDPGKAKQGSSPKPLDDGTQDEMTAILERVHTQGLADYARAIALDVAPEMARMFLPQTLMTSWVWTGSMAFFARVGALRLDTHAQYECRMIGEQIEAIVMPLFPCSWKELMDVEFPDVLNQNVFRVRARPAQLPASHQA